jgi:stage V sporulation protein B
MILLIPTLLVYGIKITVTALVLINVISELSASLVLFFFLPKNFKIKKEDLKPSRQNIINVLDIALPTTGGRLIGSIGYFFEPIILTLTLLKVGYSSNYIMTEYGIITGYVMPLLLLPGFFTAAISSALIPVVSKGYVNNNYKYVKKKLRQAIFISLAIGFPVTIILMIFPHTFLKLIYNTNHGNIYLRVIAPIFLLYYIQSPLASILQSIGKAKEMMFDNLKGIIAKTILVFALSLFKIGLFGLLIGTSINIIIVTISHYLNVKKALN